jgi:APA family basic amino acid/polyamine antiporter
MIFTGLFAAFVPGNIVGEMTSIGTLFAFILVCIGVLVLRKKNPDVPRPFRTPFVPVVPLLGIAICSAMMYSLGEDNWLRLVIWLAIGLAIYFLYGVKHSRLRQSSSLK